MARVLLVGDDGERTRGVESLLALEGHQVALVREISRWRDEERAVSPEVVVAAVATPDPVLRLPLGGARAFAPPILFVHRAADDAGESHVGERLIDRIVSPYAAEDLLGRVDALVRVRRVVLHHGRAAEGAVAKARHRVGWWGDGLASLLRSRVPRLSKPPAPYLEVAALVADWADRRDGFDAGHAERVTNFAAMIADELGLPDGEAAALLRAAMLHDIGKVALPIDVLRQKAPLEEGQLRLLRTHPERGATLLRALDKDEVVADTIHYHHEYVDGSGYYGRKGPAISRAARIVAVAEAYDAMTTSLVRVRLTREAAIGVMRERRGVQWDAECVDALVGALQPQPRTIPLSPVAF